MKKVLLSIIAMILCCSIFCQWEKISSPVGIQVNKLYNSSDTLFACTSNGVYRLQSDQWNKLSENVNFNVTSILKYNNYLFAGVSNIGIFRSIDKGKNWLKINNGLTSINVQDIKLYKGFIIVGTSSGLFVSDNNGIQWTNKTSNIGNSNIKVILENSDSLLVGTSNGFYFSSDTAKTWKSKNLGLGSSKDVSAIISVGTKLFSSFTNGGVYVSNDNAINWSAANNNLTSLNVNALFFNNDTLFAGTTDSLYYTTDLTNISWKTIATNGTSNNASTINKTKNTLLFGNSFGVHKYSNKTFKDVNSGFPNLTISKIFSMDSLMFIQTNMGIWQLNENQNYWSYNTSFPNNAIKETTPFDTSYICFNDKGLFISDKSRKTWKAVSSKKNITCMVSKFPNIFIGTSDEGIFRSTDKGKNWLPANIGITYITIKEIVILNKYLFAIGNDGVFRGGGWNGNDKIFKSDSNGDQWEAISDDYSSDLNLNILSKKNTLYRFNSTYLAKSENFGGTWLDIPLKTTITYNYSISTPSNTILFGDSLYSCDSYGIYTSLQSDTNWYKINKGYTDTTIIRYSWSTDSTVQISTINQLIGKGNNLYFFNNKNNFWKRNISSINPPKAPSDVRFNNKYYIDKLSLFQSTKQFSVNGMLYISWKNNSNAPFVGIRRYWEYADINIPSGNTSSSFNIDTLSNSKGYFNAPFYLYANDNGDWSSFSNFAILDASITGIEKINVINENYAVYPNPVSSILTVSSKQSKEPIKSITVVNSLGMIVNKIQPQLNTELIDFSAFANGLYFLNIEDNGKKNIILKIIKQ